MSSASQTAPRRRRRRIPGVLAIAALAGVVALAGCTSTTSTGGSPQPAPSSSIGSLPSTPPSTPETTTGSSTSAATNPPPPYVARVTWVSASGGRSLHVVPTPAGREAQGAPAQAEAWAEVVRLAPDAAQSGMQAQFDCHWTYARLVEPIKASWNLEPWRPVVSEARMVQSGCNPGGAESLES